MVNIIKCDKIDLDNITIEKPEKVNKFFYSKINYSNEPLYIQTHKMINIKDMENFDYKDPYIELDLNGTKMYDILSNIDDKILNTTFENWETWMNREIPLEVLDKMYIKLTKEFKVEDTPKIKIKLPISKSKLLTKVFDNKKIDCEIGELKSGFSIICIINIKGIKYNEKTFYCDAYATQIKIFKEDPVNYEITEECLIESDYDENDVIDQQELVELLKKDKINMLIQQKNEEHRLIEQINMRIENINMEIEEIKNQN
tara:strand:- start:1088 stop:1861 length:774 start_codon:yes stop_codon:yes gene_type:complete